MRVAPLLVRAAAAVELAAAGGVAQGDGRGVRAGKQVNGGGREVGAQAGGGTGRDDRLGDGVAGPGAEQPDDRGGGGLVVDGGHVGGRQRGAGRGGAQDAQDGIANGQEPRQEDRVHLGRDRQAATFVVQPGAQLRG
jgi:hypothetical protein